MTALIAATYEPLPPGIHYGISPDRYHSATLTAEPALTAGMAIELIQRGPARAWVWANMERETTDACEFGRAAHIAVLEPDRLHEAVTVIRADNWRKKADQNAKAAAREHGLIPLLEADFKKLSQMRAAIRNGLGLPFRTAPPMAEGFPSDGHAEVTIVAAGHPWLKARPDYLKQVAGDLDIITDYKITKRLTADIRWIARAYRWDMRAAFYLDAYFKATQRMATYIYLVQEVEPPFFAYHHIVPREALAVGADDAVRARKLFRQCQLTGQWPSDVDDVRILDF